MFQEKLLMMSQRDRDRLRAGSPCRKIFANRQEIDRLWH